MKNNLRTNMLLATLFLFSYCTDNKFVYIISKQDSITLTKSTRSDGVVVAHPKIRYAQSLLFLDSNMNAYFYLLSPLDANLKISDEDEQSVRLLPQKLHKISKGNEIDFLKNFLIESKNLSKLKPTLMVICAKDTLTGPFIKAIIEIKQQQSEKVDVSFRIASPSEKEFMKSRY